MREPSFASQPGVRRREKMDREIRVCFLALETYSLQGGIQRFNQRLIEGLFDKSLWSKRIAPHVLIKGDIPDRAAPPGVKQFGNDRLRMIRQALATRPDILLVGHINLLPAAALLKLRFGRIKIVLFVHGDEVWNQPGGRRRRWWEPALLRYVDCIAAVSRYTAEIMAREFGVPLKRLKIFPNAADLYSALPSRTAEDFGGRSSVLSVTRVGSGDRAKNIDKLIMAFARAVTHMGQATLEIVGDGVLRPELEALADTLGIRSRIRFLGAVSDDELSAAYERARIFALPSDKEGFGIVYLEAWRHGVPVICSNRGAPQEIVADGVDGWVVDPHDPDRFAERLADAYGDVPRAAAMGRAGRRELEKHYSGEAFRRRLTELLSGDL